MRRAQQQQPPFVTGEPGAVPCISERHLLPLFKWQPWAAVAGEAILGEQENLCAPPPPGAAGSELAALAAGATQGLEFGSPAWAHGHLCFSQAQAQHRMAQPEQRRAARGYPITCCSASCAVPGAICRKQIETERFTSLFTQIRNLGDLGRGQRSRSLRSYKANNWITQNIIYIWDSPTDRYPKHLSACLPVYHHCILGIYSQQQNNLSCLLSSCNNLSNLLGLYIKKSFPTATHLHTSISQLVYVGW